MAEARRAVPNIKFNGKSVKTSLDDYKEQLEYTDVASGNSDTISLKLYNANMKFINSWLPKKGDRITASINFKNWEKEGQEKKLSCGDFLLDELEIEGGPLEVTLGGISIPSQSSIKSTNRTKTWKKVSTKQIAEEIAKKYSLKLTYDGPSYTIASLEQTDKSDSAFLYDLCQTYGLGMKIYKSKIIIYGKSKYEAKKAVTTIRRTDFIDDDWKFTDTIDGTYTGGKASYKKSKSNKEISVYVGLVSKDAKNARTLKISEQCDSEKDAKVKAAAKVNLENESATTITGTIFVRPEIVAGICIEVKDLGKANGKYFVDEVKTKIASDGSTQEIQMHRCQKQVGESAPASKKPESKKTYKVGDVVNFHGGKQYATSTGKKGFTRRAGKAKIKKKASGKAHPYYLVHTDKKSNVNGWVNNGTFD